VSEWEKYRGLWVPQKKSPETKAWGMIAEAAGLDPVRYSAHIWDRRTGERVVYDLGEHCLWPADGSAYWWEEGNFSCDCNRGMSFYRGKGLPEDARELEDIEDGGDITCHYPERWEGQSYSQRFLVKCVAEDGTELYRDEEWEEPA
jgi:hypothetical protein